MERAARRYGGERPTLAVPPRFTAPLRVAASSCASVEAQQLANGSQPVAAYPRLRGLGARLWGLVRRQ